MAPGARFAGKSQRSAESAQNPDQASNGAPALPEVTKQIEAAIARGCRHYSESGELLATTLAVLECLQREGFVTVEKPSH